ncbi:MAG: glycosyltransferase [Oscillospiraceae bacterium]|nr:glycosyltransferase [Oscillospiraceae bacterium]MDD6502968.1 glycosyltransferase [Oscillospiraceae bacterium]
MQPAVSIIVPVYNAETTLRHCVDSILSQEFTDFELLLVDDGSQDSSGSICEEYAGRDARVRVIHQENSGVSAARNNALDRARGEYLQFLDSDDWITPDATRLLVRTAREHQCDLVIADFYRVIGARVSPKGDIEDDGVLTREEYAAHMMENPADFYYGVLWNKLYRRDIVEEHHLRMDPEVSWCEDFLFNLEYILHAERFCALQVPIYYYVKTKGSLANQSMTISRTVKTKLTLFEYYNQFYKRVLDPAEYEKNRLKVYRFLFDAAQDGAVPPPIMPGSRRLGDERVSVSAGAVSGTGLLQDGYLLRKLMLHYLEPVALKYDLTMRETGLLLCMLQDNAICTRRELEDFSNLSHRQLAAALKKLTSRGFLKIDESRRLPGGERELQIEFLPPVEPVLAAIEEAQEEYEQARLSGLTAGERETYETLTARIRENAREVLGGTPSADGERETATNYDHKGN